MGSGGEARDRGDLNLFHDCECPFFAAEAEPDVEGRGRRRKNPGPTSTFAPEDAGAGAVSVTGGYRSRSESNRWHHGDSG